MLGELSGLISTLVAVNASASHELGDHRKQILETLESVVLDAKVRQSYRQAFVHSGSEDRHWLLPDNRVADVIDFGLDALSDEELIAVGLSMVAIADLVAKSSDFWSPAWDKALARLPRHDEVTREISNMNPDLVPQSPLLPTNNEEPLLELYAKSRSVSSNGSSIEHTLEANSNSGPVVFFWYGKMDRTIRVRGTIPAKSTMCFGAKRFHLKAMKDGTFTVIGLHASMAKKLIERREVLKFEARK